MKGTNLSEKNHFITLKHYSLKYAIIIIPIASIVSICFIIQHINLIKISKFIPRSIQFIQINGLKHFSPQINAIFYITCACVLTASIVDYFILDKLYENFNIINRQKISEELIKKAFYQEKDVNVIYNNEITYQQKIYDQVIISSTKNKKVVYREESYIITDPFKKKIISLKYKSDNKYLVAGYINLQNKNIGLKDFKTDFFSKKKKATCIMSYTTIENMTEFFIKSFK